MIVHLVSLLARYLSTLFKVKHHGRTIADAEHIAHKPQVRGILGQSEEEHQRAQRLRKHTHYTELVEYALQYHQAIYQSVDHCAQLQRCPQPLLYHLPYGDDAVCHRHGSERLRHLRQYQVEVQCSEKCSHNPQHCHLERLGAYLLHHCALHWQCMAYQHHDGYDGGLAHGEVHAQHHGKTCVCGHRGSRKEGYGRCSRQSHVLKQRVKVLRHPLYHAVILQQSYGKRYGYHNLKQPQRSTCGWHKGVAQDT